MKFLVPNYSCLQNPWLGCYRPQIPVLSFLCPHLNLLNTPPPPKKFPGYATACSLVEILHICYFLRNQLPLSAPKAWTSHHKYGGSIFPSPTDTSNFHQTTRRHRPEGSKIQIRNNIYIISDNGEKLNRISRRIFKRKLERIKGKKLQNKEWEEYGKRGK